MLLEECLTAGPVVLSFYRGAWCPYCNTNLRALQSALPRVTELGATLLAISPQAPDTSLTLTEKLNLEKLDADPQALDMCADDARAATLVVDSL